MNRRNVFAGIMGSVGAGKFAAAAVPAAVPQDGVKYVMGAFAKHDIVAVAEHHGARQLHDFLLTVLHHARLPEVVGNIVVEWGNALHQRTMDRYLLELESVPETQLKPAWQDTTQRLVWDSPVYERFFRAVRQVNEHLPRATRLRVVLADPPIEWQTVKTRRQAFEWFSKREQSYFDAVESTLRSARKTLVLLGFVHVARGSKEAPNAVTCMEQKYPGKTFVILPHAGFGFGPDFDKNKDYEPLVADWPVNSIATLRGTALGALPARLINPNVLIRPGGARSDAWDSKSVEEVADAYLFNGRRDELSVWNPFPATYRDARYWAELERWHRILFGAELDPKGPLFTTESRLVQPMPAPPPPGSKPVRRIMR